MRRKEKEEHIPATGVRLTHNEFTGRGISTLDMTSGSLVECNGDLACAGDNQGHGTHCAGTAAGTQYGVAPGATIRSVKVLSDQGSGQWSWSYGALDWMASSSIRPAIASMSLGGSGTQQAMKDAVDAATSAGVSVIVAGGAAVLRLFRKFQQVSKVEKANCSKLGIVNCSANVKFLMFDYSNAKIYNSKFERVGKLLLGIRKN